jgi:hypothetical protein
MSVPLSDRHSINGSRPPTEPTHLVESRVIQKVAENGRKWPGFEKCARGAESPKLLILDRLRVQPDSNHLRTPPLSENQAFRNATNLTF